MSNPVDRRRVAVRRVTTLAFSLALVGSMIVSPLAHGEVEAPLWASPALWAPRMQTQQLSLESPASAAIRAKKPSTTTISGQVTDALSEKAVEGAVVTILETTISTTTDSFGKYSLAVSPGVYALQANKGRCLMPMTADVDATAGSAKQNFALNHLVDGLGTTCDEVPYSPISGTTRLDLTGSSAKTLVQLPFPLRFYGSDYTTLAVHTSGYVSVLDESPGFNEANPIPSTARPNGAIYALWGDMLVRGAARGAYIATLGTAPSRRFVIEYRNFEMAATGDLVNFAVVLNEGGGIEVRYNSLQGIGNGTSSTAGVEDPSGLAALQYSHNAPVLSSQTTIVYHTGQGVGFIVGTVKRDTDSAPISGASIASRGLATTSAADGQYRLPALPGSNFVEARAVYGSQEATASATVTVTSGNETIQDFSLAAPRHGALDPSELSFQATCDQESQTLILPSNGSLPLDSEASGGGGLRQIITDPEGDQVQGTLVDITGVEGGSDTSNAEFRISFSSLTRMSEIAGYIPLDTDQDAATGTPAYYLFGKPEQDVGFEYFLDLFDMPFNGRVNVWDQYGFYLGSVEGTIVRQALSFAVPLDMIGGDDGNINTSLVLGDFFQPTDWAPDAGHGTVSGGPIWMNVAFDPGTVPVGGTQTITVTVDPSLVPAGDYEAPVFVNTSDPVNPVISATIRLHVDDNRVWVGASTYSVPVPFIYPGLGLRSSGVCQALP